ncbi:MAG: ImmA/IrrE family metallo-endopeptidase [Lewinellaceae bacterium]|nr:ImmA/IrrE family metallo-endopeptidase [Lewinellaceae bacterium]
MYRYLTIKRINHIAWKILLEAGIKKPQVDVNKVAKHLKMEIREENLGEDISALLVIRNGKAIIGIHNDHYPTRQRFSIAHEIGHYVLGHERQGMFIDKHEHHFSIFYRNSLSSEGTDQQEIEANAFAAALLMPEPFVKNEIECLIKEGKPFDLSADENDPFITYLAKKFGVSRMAMTYRIGNLNIFDTM